MKPEFFEFDKFIKDLDDRRSCQEDNTRKMTQLEKNNRVRDLNRLYREHPLAKTYVGGKND